MRTVDLEAQVAQVVPGDGVVTNASLRMTRLAFMAIPETLREGPHRKAARERLTL